MAGIMVDETLQMYIEESREHLQDIESDLLEIERQGEEIDEALVNKVFRAAHSIKGGGSFLGLHTIKELAHKIENILDMIRNFQMIPRPEVVNTVLTAFDHLGLLLDHAEESNDMEIAEQVAALDRVVAAQLNGEDRAAMQKAAEIQSPDPFTIFTLTDFDMKQARKGGKVIYILEYDLIKDVHRKGKTPLDIIKALDETGTMLDLKLGLSAVGDLDSDEISTTIPMYVLFSSIIEPDIIGMVAELDEARIHVVEEETPEAAVADQDASPEAASRPAAVTPSPPETPSNPPSSPPPAPPTSPAAGRTEPETKAKPAAGQSTESLRVNVRVLDQLMNRAGELVLARNQLLQAQSLWDKQGVRAACQRIDLVTSELQETIMLTRMQPVNNIFSKFPRVVHDLAKTLGKEMELELEGKEVELDKTIIEGLGDPLTHLVRNSCDHGIERPEERKAKGKSPLGRIVLRAYHESGQIIIEIEDDGKGLDAQKIAAKALSKGLITAQQLEAMADKEKINLIMLPGFSMAETITDVSGRGVGMDVVKTNLDKLGGQIEILSEKDRRCVIRIKLPLTLAIIPSLLVASCGERFAIPQVNVAELLRIPATEIHQHIDKVGGADILTLRGELIPLLQLNNVLKLRKTYYDRKSGRFLEDRRATIADERLAREIDPGTSGQPGASPFPDSPAGQEPAAVPERRNRRESDVNIVVLQAGTFKYGLVVDIVFDTVEIVVKPLGRHLKKCTIYAGATIMGDGHVAIILDVLGVARHAELRALSEAEKAAILGTGIDKREGSAVKQSLLLFRNGPEEHCAVPLPLVLRVEQIQATDIELKGGRKVIQYRGGNLPVYALEEVARVEVLEERQSLIVILFVVAGHEVGLLAVPPLDVLELDLEVNEETLRQPGISGSAIISGKTTLMVDIFGLIEALHPEWFAGRQGGSAAGPEQEGEGGQEGGRPAILLAEDSKFFRAQVKHFIEEAGYRVIEAEDGAEALHYLEAHPESIDLVVTDIEMPNMDGYALASRIKADGRFSHLKIIALTSLAGEEDVAKGREAGIDDYQIKLDKEKLLQGISRSLRG